MDLERHTRYLCDGYPALQAPDLIRAGPFHQVIFSLIHRIHLEPPYEVGFLQRGLRPLRGLKTAQSE